MQTKPLISIIVPIYNVENFFSKCLSSIENQTYKNNEIILIDDGSTDASGKIADNFKNSHMNVTVIHKKNEGLASARNLGLEIANGQYISFVDSDDFLHHRFLERLYELLEKYDADISYCNYYFYFPKTRLRFPYPFSPLKKEYNSEKALKKIIAAYTLHSFAWNKLYKRSLFIKNNIRFEDLCFEDIATVPRLFFWAKKIAVTRKPLYYYVQRKGSALHSISATKIEDFIRSYGSLRNFLQKQEKYDIYKKSVNSYTRKAKIMKNLYILSLHLKTFDLKKLAKNIRNSNKSIEFFLDEDYEPVEGIPDIPFGVEEPESLF
ncbi:MAG: glycosyltransferase [Oscillospiraceae bacterium]|jgi:glycosyltransferase involved in cell wall biosynthesis|nr:glycosyltransferase [Oscillospiraceae bacterium]